MFYETKKNNHGLKHDPFKSCIIPRPIAWITTLSEEDIENCAPYSFFNGVSSDPPMIMFANNGPSTIKEGPKDSFSNIKNQGGHFYGKLLSMTCKLSFPVKVSTLIFCIFLPSTDDQHC